MKLRVLFFLFLFLLAISVVSQIIVLPFPISGQNHASLQWLGKAASFYLLTAYELNGIPVFSEVQVQRFLAVRHIRFPFAISKATAMEIAQENGATMMVWGKIAFAPDDAQQMSMSLFSIDLLSSQQKEVALVKGKWADLYALLQESFRRLLAVQGTSTSLVRFPVLDLSLPDFEKLVKSLLVADPGKKIEMLSPLTAKDNASDYVLFEATKALVCREDWPASEALVQRLSDQPSFRKGKVFLRSLVNIGLKQWDAARERLESLMKEQAYPCEVQNNLGVIHLLQNRYEPAEALFRRALSACRDPGVWANTIHLLLLEGKEETATGELCEALAQFPDDGKLLGLFSRMLSLHPEKVQLIPLFQEYISGFSGSEEDREFMPVLKNPFLLSLVDGLAEETGGIYAEARNLFLENDIEGALEQVNQALELNPFVPECYHLLGMVHLQKKDYAKAEAAATAALMLKQSEENYVLLIRTLEASDKKEKMQKILDLARRRYPAGQQWQGQKGR